MARLLALPIRPTAIVTTNDLMAVGALQAAHRAGINVPRDLSIIGFDDLPVAAMVNPPLTTICMSRHEIATRAFSFLLKASGVGDKKLPFKRDIRPRLVVRGSTAPPVPS
jgi:DNA-binding LacI/PurR family transcriptional regulator